MPTPCTPKLNQFPGAWPEPPSPEPSYSDSPPVMQATDYPALTTTGLLEESHRSPSSRSVGSATQLASLRKAPPLRIIVPPTEYCPFSTDLTLPITPLSLPTPVSSSCFTFNDAHEVVAQGLSSPPTPGLVLSPCSQDAAVAAFPSPTSSQFLLMPPTPHSLHVGNEAAISASPPATPAATNHLVLCESDANKIVNPRPWEVPSSTWLSDLGGYTETDRIFRQNLLEIASVDTHSRPSSSLALSLGAAYPPSPIFSSVANHLPNALLRSPVASSLSPYPTSMSSPLSARLVLMPTGTDTFPSTFDGLEAWREGVTPGAPRFEEPCSLSHEDVPSPASPGAILAELVPETPVIHRSLHPLPRTPRLSKSQTFIKRAKRFGGRVKQFVSRQTANKYRVSSDRDVSFRIVTSQDSDNGSIIVISAPPPPYNIRPPTPIPPRSPTRHGHARSRTVSEYSSALQGSTLERATSGVTESSSRRGGRNTLRRLSLAAFSTIKRA